MSQTTQYALLRIDGQDVPVVTRATSTAKRMTLRLDPHTDTVRVTHPRGVAKIHAERFARDKADWIAARLAELPPRRPIADGAAVPLLGADHVVRAHPTARRGVWAENGEINVSGRLEFLPRRVIGWMRDRARGEITPRARAHADALRRRRGQLNNVQLGRITVRDQKSRWGSCSARGDLSFSWRLVMAPEPVLDYVIAHEVAHLVEMNHSHRFWAIVHDLVGDNRDARDWLTRHGTSLHRIG